MPVDGNSMVPSVKSQKIKLLTRNYDTQHKWCEKLGK